MWFWSKLMPNDGLRMLRTFSLLMLYLLPQRVIYVPSVGLLATDSPPAAQRHQLICWIGIFLQHKQ